MVNELHEFCNSYLQVILGVPVFAIIALSVPVIGKIRTWRFKRAIKQSMNAKRSNVQ